MHHTYSPSSSGSSSLSPSAPPTSNKLTKREHPTLGTLHDLQPSPTKHQPNKLRKPMHNGDLHKVGVSFDDPDEVVLADDEFPPTGEYIQQTIWDRVSGREISAEPILLA
jgi:hypothetical protein